MVSVTGWSDILMVRMYTSMSLLKNYLDFILKNLASRLFGSFIVIFSFRILPDGIERKLQDTLLRVWLRHLGTRSKSG